MPTVPIKSSSDCAHTSLSMDHILPIFMNSLHPDYAHFCDEYLYFEFLFEIAEARYDVLASLLSYLNKHSYTLFTCIISDWYKDQPRFIWFMYKSTFNSLAHHFKLLQETKSCILSRFLTQVASEVSRKIYFISAFYNIQSIFLFLTFRNISQSSSF